MGINIEIKRCFISFYSYSESFLFFFWGKLIAFFIYFLITEVKRGGAELFLLVFSYLENNIILLEIVPSE